MDNHTDWNAVWRSYRPHHIQKIKRLYRFFGFESLDRSLRVLDLGCGTGDFVKLLRSQGFVNACGWEPQEELVAAAQDTSVTHGNCLDIGSHGGEYDVVTMFGVLHHLQDFNEVRKCVVNVHALLKPGGRFYSYEQRATVARSCATAILLNAPPVLLPQRLQLDRKMVEAEKRELDLWLTYEGDCTREFMQRGFELTVCKRDWLYRYLVFTKA